MRRKLIGEIVGQFHCLQTIATSLNDTRLTTCWPTILDIVRHVGDPNLKGVGDPLERAVGAFALYARAVPVHMKVHYYTRKKGGKQPNCILDAPGDLGTFLSFLWRFYFQDKGWERLKRCPQCRKWFVDTIRNKNKIRCSRQCTDKWWDFRRRKHVGHATSRGQKPERQGRRIKA